MFYLVHDAILEHPFALNRATQAEGRAKVAPERLLKTYSALEGLEEGRTSRWIELITLCFSGGYIHENASVFLAGLLIGISIGVIKDGCQEFGLERRSCVRPCQELADKHESVIKATYVT